MAWYTEKGRGTNLKPSWLTITQFAYWLHLKLYSNNFFCNLSIWKQILECGKWNTKPNTFVAANRNIGCVWILVVTASKGITDVRDNFTNHIRSKKIIPHSSTDPLVTNCLYWPLNWWIYCRPDFKNIFQVCWYSRFE